MQRVDSSKEGLDCVWPKNDEVYEISFKFVKQINLGAQAGGGGGGFWKDHILFRGMKGDHEVGIMIMNIAEPYGGS